MGGWGSLDPPEKIELELMDIFHFFLFSHIQGIFADRKAMWSCCFGVLGFSALEKSPGDWNSSC